MQAGQLLDIPTAEVFEPLLEDCRYKGARGGRASGKSHFFADLLVERCLMRSRTRWLCGREYQRDLAHSSKQLLEDKIRKYKLENKRYFTIQRDRILTPGDGIIIFQGLQEHSAESLKSIEDFNGAWIEEAQTTSRRSWGLLYPSIRTKDSEIWASWNPYAPNDPVDEFYCEGRADKAKDVRLIDANFYDNPWFPEVSQKDMERDKRRDPERYNHIWLGKYLRHSAARVFKNWRVGSNAEMAAARAKCTRFYQGADFGFSIDPSCLVQIGMVDRTLYIFAEAYKLGCEIDKLPFLFGGAQDKPLRLLNAQAWNALTAGEKNWRGIPEARRWPIIADSARPDTISYLKRHGFTNVEGAQKGARSLEEGVEFLQTFDIVIAADCTYTIDEFTMYSYAVDKKTEEVLPKLQDKDNHVIDSCRYAVEKVRRSNYTLDHIS